MPAYGIVEILRLAEAYRSATRHTLSTVSLRIAKQGSLFGRIEKGESSLTLRRGECIVQAFSDRWPEHLEWPPDIPRPAPSPASEAKEAA